MSFLEILSLSVVALMAFQTWFARVDTHRTVKTLIIMMRIQNEQANLREEAIWERARRDIQTFSAVLDRTNQALTQRYGSTQGFTPAPPPTNSNTKTRHERMKDMAVGG